MQSLTSCSCERLQYLPTVIIVAHLAWGSCCGFWRMILITTAIMVDGFLESVLQRQPKHINLSVQSNQLGFSPRPALPLNEPLTKFSGLTHRSSIFKPLFSPINVRTARTFLRSSVLLQHTQPHSLMYTSHQTVSHFLPYTMFFSLLTCCPG